MESMFSRIEDFSDGAALSPKGLRTRLSISLGVGNERSER